MRNPIVEKVLLTEEEIAKRVEELARTIAGEEEEEAYEVVLPCLTGALVFGADFVRAFARARGYKSLEIGYCQPPSSYAGKATVSNNNDSSGRVFVRGRVRNKNVLVVEDIVDTGGTLSKLANALLNDHKAKSVAVVALLNKQERRISECERELKKTLRKRYVGFEIPDEFVVGYGLDYDGLYRDLPFIGVPKPEVL